MIPTGTAARTNCVQLWPTANCTSAHHPCRQSGGGVYALITDCSLSTPNLKAELHGLRLVRGTGRANGNDYIPLRFLYNEKISNTDRLLLAFDAFVFSQAVGIDPRHGEFIHGREQRTAKVPLTPLYNKVRAALTAIAAQEAQSAPPPVVLNKHCAECQYAPHCGADRQERR